MKKEKSENLSSCNLSESVKIFKELADKHNSEKEQKIKEKQKIRDDFIETRVPIMITQATYFVLDEAYDIAKNNGSYAYQIHFMSYTKLYEDDFATYLEPEPWLAFIIRPSLLIGGINFRNEICLLVVKGVLNNLKAAGFNISMPLELGDFDIENENYDTLDDKLARKDCKGFYPCICWKSLKL